MYLLDVWRGRWRRAIGLRHSAIWSDLEAHRVGHGDGTDQSAIGPFLDSNACSERRTLVAVESFASRHDKAVRAQSIRGRMELDGLYVPDPSTLVPGIPERATELPCRQT